MKRLIALFTLALFALSFAVSAAWTDPAAKSPVARQGKKRAAKVRHDDSTATQLAEFEPQAATVEVITLKESLAEVLGTYPRVLEKLKEYNATAADQSRSAAAWRGSVDLEAETGWEEASNSSTRFSGRDGRVAGAHATAKKLLGDGNRTASDLKAREALSRSSLFDYCDAANQTAFEATEAYLLVLKATALMQLAEESVETHRKILESIKVRVAAGAEGRSELERVHGRLAAAQAVLIGRQNDYKRAVYNLEKYLGRFVDSDEMIRPVFPNEWLPTSLDEAIRKQQVDHPVLIAADYNIDVKRWEHAREAAEYRPIVYAEATRDWRLDWSGVDGSDNDTRALLKVRYNLYDGGARDAKLDRTASLIHRETEIRNRVRRTLYNDLELTWTGYKLLESQMGAIRQNIVYTKQALNSYKEEFKVGKRLLIHILDAENEYQAARAQLASAKYDLLIVKFRLLHSMGTLVNDLGLKTPLADELKIAKRMRPATKDPLPVMDDLDHDKILNKFDLAMNSKPDGATDDLGSEPLKSKLYLRDKKEQGSGPYAAVRERADLVLHKFQPDVLTEFDFVSFEKKSVELAQKTKRVMREVVDQLRAYAMDGIIQITVGTREMGSAHENEHLALERAYNIKKILAVHGLEPEAIQVFTESGTTKENAVMFKIVTDVAGMRKGYETVSRDAIRFEKGSTRLEGGAVAGLRALGEELRRLGNPPVDIVVYSNDGGNSSKNRQISEKRGEALAAGLARCGAPESTLFPIPWGDYNASQDLYDNTDEAEIAAELELADGAAGTLGTAETRLDSGTGETLLDGPGAEIADDTGEAGLTDAGGPTNPPKAEPRITNKVEFVIRGQ